MNRRWIWWATLLLAAVILAMAPIWVPREIGRWYLAAAANAFRLDDGEQAEQYLAKSLQWDPSLLQDGDYWIAQIANKRGRTGDEQLDLLEKAAKVDSRFGRYAELMANQFLEEYDFQRAVRALKLKFADGRPHTADDLNALAYFRSLAGLELDEALVDIDRGLTMLQDERVRQMTSPSDFKLAKCMMLDTKAWVLHGLQRDLEALPLVAEAIEGTEEILGTIDLDSLPPAENDMTPGSAESFDSSFWGDLVGNRQRIENAKKRYGPQSWNLVVLHFHRLKILEALKQSREVADERQWLSDRGVPITDELF